jgi:hypothetical protein
MFGQGKTRSPEVGLRARINYWVMKKLLHPAQQMSARQVLLSVFIGLWFGLFPVPGLSTLMLTVYTVVIRTLLWRYRLNTAQTTLAFSVNLLATPLCFILIPCWITIGVEIFRQDISRCSISEISRSFETDGVIPTSGRFALCIGAGVSVWLMMTPVVLLIALKIGVDVTLSASSTPSELMTEDQENTGLIGKGHAIRAPVQRSAGGSEASLTDDHTTAKRRPRSSNALSPSGHKEMIV